MSAEVGKAHEGVHLRLWGLPVLDKDRSALPDGLRDFAVVESALRLSRYQSKGDVATFSEALEYFSEFTDSSALVGIRE